MRLFIGLPFSHQARRDSLLAQRPLEKNAVKGSFTAPSNFHLTLAFLGEVEEGRLPAAFAALDAVPSAPLSLIFEGLHCFEGGIWYLSPAPCAALMKVQVQLVKSLREQGLSPEDRPYIPHLTLGRKILLREGYSPPKVLPRPISARSEGPRLFLSHRVDGLLRYDVLTP